MAQYVGTRGGAPTRDSEEDIVRARVNLKMTKAMHFKIQAGALVLGLSMQEAVMTAVEEWLARNHETIRKAIRRAEETGAITFSGSEEEDGVETSDKEYDPGGGVDPSLRRS